jgi:geranylgeranyl diphosphate synthase type II
MIEDSLARYVADSRGEKLFEAMRYGVFPGGKRLRPVLLMMVAEALGSKPEVILPAACAVELIHCFSLLHDDLPCMDNDDFRRGLPSAHRKFGEAMALLAGDGLLAMAFEAASGCADREILSELAEAAGGRGMTGGQALEVEWEGRQAGGEVLMEIHRRKTGALIRAAVRCGAILAGADRRALSALTAYAEELGLAFQIVDDILDFGQDGKSKGFVQAYGMERSRGMAGEYTEKAVHSLSCFGREADMLRSFAFSMLERGS